MTNEVHFHANLKEATMLLRLLTLAIVAAILHGCSMRGSLQHLESSPTEVARARSLAGHINRATVYFYRNRPIGTINPGLLPPYYFAVDERLISTMPVGTYVVLSLEPGKHKFTRLHELNGWRGIGFSRDDLDLEVQAGKTYFVSTTNGLGMLLGSFRLVDADQGRQFLDTALLAKIYHSPIPLDRFIDQSTATRKKTTAKRNAGGTVAPATVRQPSSATSLSSVLPSAEQIGQVLETLAVVAFVAIMIVGAGTAAYGAGAGLASLPPNAPLPRVEAEVMQSEVVPLVKSTWSTSSGTVTLNTEKRNTTIFNTSTGVIYQANGNLISGSDGSYYQRSGNALFSNTGQTYQIVGDQIISSDGRSCLRNGNFISCN